MSESEGLMVGERVLVDESSLILQASLHHGLDHMARLDSVVCDEG